MRLRRAFLVAPMLLPLGACGSASATPAATASVSSSPVAVPRPTALPADAYPVMAALQGHLAGKWTNTTYSTNGTMAWDVSADSSARTVTIVVTITGNAFGMPAPAPERIELTHLAQGRIGGPSMAFGTVNGTITSTGHLQMTLTQLPVAMITKVDVSGMLTATSVTLNYTVTFSGGGTATGTVTMSK